MPKRTHGNCLPNSIAILLQHLTTLAITRLRNAESSSSSVHGRRSSVTMMCQRRLHCSLERPGTASAILFQFFASNFLTATRSSSSSDALHFTPLIALVAELDGASRFSDDVFFVSESDKLSESDVPLLADVLERVVDEDDDGYFLGVIFF